MVSHTSKRQERLVVALKWLVGGAMYLDNRIAHTEAKQKPMCGRISRPGDPPLRLRVQGQGQQSRIASVEGGEKFEVFP